MCKYLGLKQYRRMEPYLGPVPRTIAEKEVHPDDGEASIQ